MTIQQRPKEYNVSATFNVTDLSPFLGEEDPDLRTNPSQVEENDVCTDLRPSNDPVRVPLSLVTRARTKCFKESLQTLVRNVQDQQGVHRDIEGLEGDNQVVYTMIQTHEESP